MQRVSTSPFENAAFRLTPDLRFLFSCESHEKAFAALYGGIEAGKRLFLVTGGFGVGKTLLLRRIQAALTQSGRPSTYIGLPDSDLLNLLTDATTEASVPGPSEVLLVDDADRSSHELLRSLESQYSSSRRSSRSLQIVLAGGSEFGSVLAADFPALLHSVDIGVKVEPLRGPETTAYIRHRLGVSGFPEIHVAEDAIERIAAFAGGIPRLINHICARALLLAGPQRLISREIVSEAIDDYRATVTFSSEASPAFLREVQLIALDSRRSSVMPDTAEAVPRESHAASESPPPVDGNPSAAAPQSSGQKNESLPAPPPQDTNPSIGPGVKSQPSPATNDDDRLPPKPIDEDVSIPPRPEQDSPELSSRVRLRRRRIQVDPAPKGLRHASYNAPGHNRLEAPRPAFAGFRPRRNATYTPPKAGSAEDSRTPSRRGPMAIAFCLTLLAIAAISVAAVRRHSEIYAMAIEHGAASLTTTGDAWRAFKSEVSELFDKIRHFGGP